MSTERSEIDNAPAPGYGRYVWLLLVFAVCCVVITTRVSRGIAEAEAIAHFKNKPGLRLSSISTAGPTIFVDLAKRFDVPFQFVPFVHVTEIDLTNKTIDRSDLIFRLYSGICG